MTDKELVAFQPWSPLKSTLHDRFQLAYHSPKLVTDYLFEDEEQAQRICDRLNDLEQECPWWMLSKQDANSRVKEAIAYANL